ncbi:MAG: VWA domain-containing protein [Planctomycetota bacterium]|nr:VWA domain-containing protein [Planctomycetota bacterium]
MPEKRTFGGIVHTYQKYDPARFPSPTTPPADLVSPAMEHMLMFGNMRDLSEEELARAIRLDPSQIAGLGPSLDSLMFMLRERKRKILETYEVDSVQKSARNQYRNLGQKIQPPKKFRDWFHQAFRDEQIYDLEQLYLAQKDDTSPFAGQLVQLTDRLTDKYEIDELESKYSFTGRTSMTVPQAIEIKAELEMIDRLLKQLEEAAKNAQIGIIDMDALSQFAEPEDIANLDSLRQQVEDYVREVAEQQGLERSDRGQYRITPKAMRLFQGKLLEKIFDSLEASRTGRHQGPIIGEGAVELPATKPYEFGDSVANMDIPASLTNAMLRGGSTLPIRMKAEDIEIHRTRNTPKCATSVLMDMSGSMRQGGQYINVKRMALALEGLIRSEYPGDFVQFIEMATFAVPKPASEIAGLMPKPVTIFDPIVRLKADMSDAKISQMQIPPHFTNIQHALQLARQHLSRQDTPNRQIILITDGLPTAHFEGSDLFMLYPPSSRTEQATMREGQLCQREHVTINIFLLPSWSQSSEDIQFAYRLAESTRGRVFFTAGNDLDRYVVWDYLNRRRSIIS